MQVYDERTAGMHWQRQKVGAEHYRELRMRAQRVGSPDGGGGRALGRRSVDIMARSGGGARGPTASGRRERWKSRWPSAPIPR